MSELNLNEMEQISGGAGGSSTHLPPKSGCAEHLIQTGETLSRIAGRFGTTVDYLMSINKGIITNANFIRAGFYMYVPA